MRDMDIESLVRETASSSPTPGGGSIAAFTGALSAALSEMVASLTVGKKKYADKEADMRKALLGLKAIREELLEAMEKDASSFSSYMEALKLPKSTKEEQDIRKAAMQEGLKKAAEVPLFVARSASKIFPYAGYLVSEGNKTVVTDGMISSMLAKTAVAASACNIRVNLASIEDESYTESLSIEIAELEEKALRFEKEIVAAGYARIREL